MLVIRRCMFLLSLTATCQVCKVSLKAGRYTYKALAERRGTASARPSLPLCPAPEAQRSATLGLASNPKHREEEQRAKPMTQNAHLQSGVLSSPADAMLRRAISATLTAPARNR